MTSKTMLAALIATVLIATTMLTACTQSPPPQEPAAPDKTAAQGTPPQTQVESQKEAHHLELLDQMDFDFYSHQHWDRIGESHAPDVAVFWPDGRQTKGLPVHIEDMKPQFVFVPDAHITAHPVRIASGDWTGMIGVATGTFTKPMPVPGGEPIAPTGKSFTFNMATISHWRDGLMDQEYLFWDNANAAQQMGLAKGAPSAPRVDAGPFPQSGTDNGVPDDVIAKRLKTLDEMDFVVYSSQKWDRLPESHAKDVVVVWPDGRTTQGIDVHIKDMSAQFVWAPDTKVTAHPVKFGQGDWTVLIGVMEGTFSRPMPNPAGGPPIPPTNKKFKLQMATYSHWNGDVMDREYLFWDNAEFMKQIGVAY